MIPGKIHANELQVEDLTAETGVLPSAGYTAV
jgi:hypothetical protein